MAYERTQLMVPAVASATAVHAAVTLTAAAQTVTTAITDPAAYRAVSVKGNQAGVTGNVVVTGTDWNGGTITDTIALNGASTVAGVRAFRTVVSILLPALAGAGDTVSVGIADVFGLYGSVTAEADVMLQERAASAASEFTIEATGTVNTTYDTVATAIVSGDRIRWTYLDSGTTAASSVLFSVSDARAFDKAQLASEATYPDATIETAEAAIRSEFARHVGVSFVPVVTTEYVNGTGDNWLELGSHNPYSESPPRGVSVSSVTEIDTAGTETAFTADELTDLVCEAGVIFRRGGSHFGRGRRNYQVVYTHGYATVPEDVKRAALIVLTKRLQPTDVSFYAGSGTMEGINWTRNPDPTRQRWYGIEEVDGILRAYWLAETAWRVA